MIWIIIILRSVTFTLEMLVTCMREHDQRCERVDSMFAITCDNILAVVSVTRWWTECLLCQVTTYWLRSMSPDGWQNVCCVRWQNIDYGQCHRMVDSMFAVSGDNILTTVRVTEWLTVCLLCQMTKYWLWSVSPKGWQYVCCVRWQHIDGSECGETMWYGCTERVNHSRLSLCPRGRQAGSDWVEKYRRWTDGGRKHSRREWSRGPGHSGG